MNEPIDDRLRAHFADRAAHEPLPDDDPASALEALIDQGGARRPPWRRRPFLIAAAAAVVALVAGGVALASDDGDQELRLVDDPTTTTIEPSTTATTESVTTTTLQQAAARAVIVSVDGVVGWWDGSGWVQPAPADTVPVEGGERYRVLGIGVAPRDATGSAAEGGGEFCQPGIQVDVGLEYPTGAFGHPPIALSGVDDPLPRPIEELDPTSDEYRSIASVWLEELVRVDDADPRLAQLVRTDLDGDGSDEVIMVIERLADQDLYAAPGDYSVVLVHSVVDGQPRTSVLYQSVAEGGDGVTPFVQIARVSAIADLNSDGRMEIALWQRYYEGSGTVVFTTDAGGNPQEVLRAGCGV